MERGAVCRASCRLNAWTRRGAMDTVDCSSGVDEPLKNITMGSVCGGALRVGMTPVSVSHQRALPRQCASLSRVVPCLPDA